VLLSTRAFREKLAAAPLCHDVVSLGGLGRSSSGGFKRSRVSITLTIKLFINYDLAKSVDGPSGKTLMGATRYRQARGDGRLQRTDLSQLQIELRIARGPLTLRINAKQLDNHVLESIAGQAVVGACSYVRRWLPLCERRRGRL
jgi:hypothetical protein